MELKRGAPDPQGHTPLRAARLASLCHAHVGAPIPSVPNRRDGVMRSNTPRLSDSSPVSRVPGELIASVAHVATSSQPGHMLHAAAFTGSPRPVPLTSEPNSSLSRCSSGEMPSPPFSNSNLGSGESLSETAFVRQHRGGGCTNGAMGGIARINDSDEVFSSACSNSARCRRCQMSATAFRRQRRACVSVDSVVVEVAASAPAPVDSGTMSTPPRSKSAHCRRHLISGTAFRRQRR
jgi:hypothetical protein